MNPLSILNIPKVGRLVPNATSQAGNTRSIRQSSASKKVGRFRRTERQRQSVNRRFCPSWTLCILCAFALNLSAQPIQWTPPPFFDPDISGQGLLQLPDIHTETLYAPQPSKAPPEDGGNGRYESLEHGTYNHHTQAVLFGDKIIIYWTNHARDENGPGQRLLARWGTISPDRESIDWGTPQTNLIELVPPPAPALRREPLEDTKDRRYVEGHLQVIDGQLRSTGTIAIYHGWTNDLAFRTPNGPIPDEKFSELRNNDTSHRDDMRWDTGVRYYQLWKFENNRLVPATPLYLNKSPPEKLQLTPKKSLSFGPLLPPYKEAPLISTLPQQQQDLLTKRYQSPDSSKRAGYAPNTRHLAANGKNRLAHMAQFQRPDGTCVIIRDNLSDPPFYYAAESKPGENYPPAVKTNLYGVAMPSAGELPDKTCWILSNTENRFDFFLTLSKDGRRFDRSYAIVHDATYWNRGLYKPVVSGPQYPYTLTIGSSVWIFYSVGKEQIAATQIPFASLFQNEQSILPNQFQRWQSPTPDNLKATPENLTLTTPPNGSTTALLAFPPAAIENPGDSLRLHFQITPNRSLLAPANNIHLTLLNAGTSSGYTLTLFPRTAAGRAAAALQQQTPQGAVPLVTTDAFPTKLGVLQKYDIQLLLERTRIGLKITARIFGGKLPAPVELATRDNGTPTLAFNALALILNGADPAEITLNNYEIIRATPLPVPSSTPAGEQSSLEQTATTHQMMSE